MEVTFRAGPDRGTPREVVRPVAPKILHTHGFVLEIGPDGLWGLPGVFHRVSEQFGGCFGPGELEKSIEHESDPSRLSFAHHHRPKSEFDHRISSQNHGIDRYYPI